jgi:hypothetical protein
MTILNMKLQTKQVPMNVKNRITLTFTLLLLCSASFGQSLNQNWKKDLEKSLAEFLECTNSTGEKYQCSGFIGEAIAKVYNTNAFFSQKLSRFLRINEISSSLVEDGQWTQLGRAYDQEALAKAQNQANASKAVIAVYTTANGIGHIAVILPGKLQYSGTWGYNVPNAASFVFNDTGKSFVDKGLSYAFTKSMIKDIVLYSHK